MKDSQEHIWKKPNKLKSRQHFPESEIHFHIKVKETTHPGLSYSNSTNIYFLHEKVAEEMKLASLQMISP